MTNGVDIVRSFKILGKSIFHASESYDKVKSTIRSTDVERELNNTSCYLKRAVTAIDKILGKPKLEPAFAEPKDKVTPADMLTWLNGRAINITVMHEGKPNTVWLPSDDVSIEDRILCFTKEHDIDLLEESYPNGR
jgi:hypothetical protein